MFTQKKKYIMLSKHLSAQIFVDTLLIIFGYTGYKDINGARNEANSFGFVKKMLKNTKNLSIMHSSRPVHIVSYRVQNEKLKTQT